MGAGQKASEILDAGGDGNVPYLDCSVGYTRVIKLHRTKDIHTHK